MAVTREQLNQRIQLAKQQGWDDARISRALQSTVQRSGGLAAATQQQAPKRQGNLLAQLAPMLGSVGGAVLGGLATGGVGALAGGAAGGAAGERYRQKLMGEDTNWGAVATEGALGALGNVGGAVKVLRGAVTAAKAAKTAGLVEKGLQAVGGKVAGAGESLATKSLRATPKQLSGFAAKHGEDIVPVLQREGLVGRSPEAIKTTIEPIQRQFSNMIAKTKIQVDPKQVEQSFIERMRPLLNSTDPDDARVAKRIQENMKNVLTSVKKDPSATNLDKLRRAYDSKVNYKLADQDLLKYTEKKAIADALRSTLQSTVDRSGLTGPLGENLKQLGTRLNKLYDVSKIADTQAHLGRGSLPAGMLQLLSFGGGGAAMGGPAGAIAGFAVQQAINSPAGMRIGSRLLTQSGEKIASGANRVGEGLRIATRTGAGRVAGGAVLGNSQAQAGEPDDLFAQYSALGDQAMQDIDMGDIEQTAAPQYDQSVFLQAMLEDLAATGGKNISKIETIAKFAGAGSNAKTGKTGRASLTADQRKVAGYADRMREANDIFDRLEPEISSALTSPISIARSIPDRIKSSVVKQQEQAERNFINAVLRRESGAAISPSEFENAAKQYFPQPGDSPEVLEQKRQNRLLVMNGYYQEVGEAGSSAESLTDQLNSLLAG